MEIKEWCKRQQEWSYNTFGPGHRTKGLIDHIQKELKEIEAKPLDLEEWLDVVILALDGAWRSGASPAQIEHALIVKQVINRDREWSDWREVGEDKAIEHIEGERK